MTNKIGYFLLLSSSSVLISMNYEQLFNFIFFYFIYLPICTIVYNIITTLHNKYLCKKTFDSLKWTSTLTICNFTVKIFNIYIQKYMLFLLFDLNLFVI